MSMKFQELFYRAMDRYIPPIEEAVVGGEKLNLGAGKKVFKGYTPLDYPEWDADSMPIPFADESVGAICAFHFLEHVKDPVAVLLECQRVLKLGGVMNICVPYYNSQMAAHDLDHKKVFCEETWRVLFSNPYYNKNKIQWRFVVGFNLICGVVERNMCLITQLIKI